MRLSKDTLKAIYADARARLPNEACGFIVSVGRANRYVPAENTAANPVEDFRISAGAWADAEDQGRVAAIVHSHPGQSARLSHADRVSMESTGLPWLVVEVREGEPTGHMIHEPTGYQAPLVGRPFSYNVMNCYTLVRDYYRREMGIELAEVDTEDGWWDRGEDVYPENFERVGFYPIDPSDLRQGDMIVMQVRSPVANHAGVYLADGVLKTEPDLHPVPGAILHHLYGRDSVRVPFGGFWREAARFYMRHKDSPDG